MKKLLYTFAILLVITACGKWKDGKSKSLTYYAADYKEKEVGFFNTPYTEIDAVWFDFHQKDANSKDYNRYTMNVKANGNVVKAMGTCVIDWNDKITFTPDSGNSFYGVWKFEKEKYAITYEMDGRKESVIFVYKKKDHCK